MVDFKQNKLPRSFSDIYQSNKSTQMNKQTRQSDVFYEKKDVTRPLLTNCQFTISQRFGINGPTSSKKPIRIVISRQEWGNHYCRNIKTL